MPRVLALRALLPLTAILLLTAAPARAADPPANDNFASPELLTGTAATATTDTSSATIEAGEPRPAYAYGARSVWYSWTAPSDGGVVIDTSGSAFDTALGVYTGDAIDGLTAVTYNNDASTGVRTSRVVLRATAGVTYRILVNGYPSNAFGEVRLALELRPPPANDAFADATSLGSASTASTTGHNLAATAETGEPLHFPYDPARASAWYSWTAPSSGSLTIKATSSFQPTIAAYTGETLTGLTRVRNQAQDWNGGPEQIRIRVEAGTTYRIVVDSRYGGGDFTLELQLVASPVNDDFAAALPLVGVTADVAGSTVHATQEACEPVHDDNYYDPSVWYTWTAPQSGGVTIDTEGSSFPTVLGIYTGDALCSLTRVAVTRLTGAGVPAKRTFRATAGVTYRIAVDGQRGRMGDYKLSLRVSDPPPNDLLASAEALTGSTVSAPGTLLGATTETGEQSRGGATGATVWYSWTAPATGPARLSIPAGSYDTVIAVHTGTAIDALTSVVRGTARYGVSFRATAGTTYLIAVDGGAPPAQHDFTLDLKHVPAPANDDFAAALPIAGSAASLTGTNAGATTEPGEPGGYSEGASIWYSWTAPTDGTVRIDTTGSDFNTAVRVYTGDTLGGLQLVGSSGSSWYYSYTAKIALRVRAGTTYRIRVAGYYSDTGELKLALDLRSPPANDAWALATPLTSAAPVTAAGSTLGASAETGEPGHFQYGSASASVWYSWTAPANGALTIRATGDFQPVLAAYTGGQVAALTRVRNQPQDWNGGSEQIRVRVTAGTTYYVAVDASGVPGDFSLTLELVPHPPNDDFEDAVELVGLAVDTVGSTVGATQEDCEPVHDDNYYDPSVWYTWTAPESGAITLDTAGSGFPTVLGVYTGDILCKLERVPLRRMSTAAEMAKRGFRAVAGETYRIAVDGARAKMGDFALSLRHQPAPANDMLASAEVLEGVADVATGTNFGATSEPAEPGAPAAASVWYSWTAPTTGLTRVELPEGDFAGRVDAYTGDSIAALTAVSRSDDYYYSYDPLQFRSVAGTTYRIAVRGQTWNAGAGQGDFTLKLTAAAGPPNDDFANRAEIEGAGGRVDGTVMNATREPGERRYDYYYGNASVWYSWTAPETGLASFTLPYGGGASYVAAFEGDVLASLTQVGASDYGARFRVEAGKTYRIVVAGRQSFERGAFALTWETIPPPGNDAFADAIELAGENVSRTGTTAGATSEPGEPSQSSSSYSYSYYYSSEQATVWYSWTAPSSGLAVIKSTSGSLAAYTGDAVDQLQQVASAWSYYSPKAYFRAVAGRTYRIRVAGGLTVAPASFTLTVKLTPPPANDDFENAATLGDSASGTTAGGTAQDGEPLRSGYNRATVWYSWTPATSGTGVVSLKNTYDHGLTVFTGDSLGTLERRAAAGYYGPARLRVTAGTTYRIAVDRELSESYGTFGLTTAVLPAPANDDFAGATELTGTSDRRSGSNANATSEPGEPSHAGSGHSVWYRWTAPSSGKVTVDLSGSAFDTILAAYTGDSVGSLTRAGHDHDSGEGSASKLSLRVRAGTTYHFAVDADYVTPGAIALALAHEPAPANDDFSAAAEISGSVAAATGDNRRATREHDEPANMYWGGSGTIWYSWTAPADGRTTIDLSGSSFDTTLGVYEGAAVGALSRVASADNGGTGGASKLSFAAVAGRTYRISVDGSYGSEGDVQLALSQLPAPANDRFAAAATVTGTGVVATGDNSAATREPGEPHNYAYAGASVWYRWEAPTSGTVTLSGNGAFSVRLGAYTGGNLSGLVQLAGGTQTIRFQASAGTTYWFVVDGEYSSHVGRFDLTIGLQRPPVNDLFASATVLTGLTAEVSGDTTAATQEPCEPIHDDNYRDPSVWFSWTATVDGRVELDTSGSAFRTVLGVYTGVEICALARVTVERLSNWNEPARRAFQARAGTTYRIAVDGADGATGRFALALRQTPDAPAEAPAQPTRVEEPPPDESPPDENPPTDGEPQDVGGDAPPITEPARDGTPVADPPSDDGPKDDQPAGSQPGGEQPAGDQPPPGDPAQSDPPPGDPAQSDPPPADTRPADTPPAGTPPADTPPADTSPGDPPESGPLASGDPPAGGPPALDPPALGGPPSSPAPPGQDPPAGDPDPFTVTATYPRQKLGAVLSKGLGGEVVCSADCTFTVVAQLDAAIARKHRLRGSKATLVRVKGTASARRPARVVIKLPRSAQKRLKTAREVPLTVMVSAMSERRPAEHPTRLTLRR